MRGRGRALGLAPAGASSPPLPSLGFLPAPWSAGSRRRRRCFFHGRSPDGPSGLCTKVFVTSPYPKRLQRHEGDEIDADETAGKWRPLGSVEHKYWFVMGFPGGSVVNNPETRVRSLDGKDPLQRKMATLSYSWLGKSHGQRSLADYSSWGRKSRTRLSG